MIKIDKNIPIPEKKQGRKCKYPTNVMEVGDSFLVSSRNIANSICHNANKRHPDKKFTSCCEMNENYRVWRVE
jgi:hypothetical protein